MKNANDFTPKELLDHLRMACGFVDITNPKTSRYTKKRTTQVPTDFDNSIAIEPLSSPETNLSGGVESRHVGTTDIQGGSKVARSKVRSAGCLNKSVHSNTSGVAESGSSAPPAQSVHEDHNDKEHLQ
jgi:hypothetical protein